MSNKSMNYVLCATDGPRTIGVKNGAYCIYLEKSEYDELLENRKFQSIQEIQLSLDGFGKQNVMLSLQATIYVLAGFFDDFTNSTLTDLYKDLVDRLNHIYNQV